MDIKLVAGSSLLVAIMLSFCEVSEAIDPYYIPRAKILTRHEVVPETGGFHPTPRKCKRLGERAAKKSLSCIASESFYYSMINRVHMSRAANSRNIQETKSIAQRISKCSVKYGNYYAKACTQQKTYLNARKQCLRLHSRRERTECKGEISRRFIRVDLQSNIGVTVTGCRYVGNHEYMKPYFVRHISKEALCGNQFH